VQQELSDPERIVVSVVGKRVGPDVQLVDKHLAVYNPAIGVLEVGLAKPQGFHLGSRKNQPGLELVYDKEIKPGFTVDGDGFYSTLWHNKYDLKQFISIVVIKKRYTV
jgi:hypothetical protein